MANYEIDWKKHNNRDKGQIRTDIMTQAFHSKVDATQTARILFAAGYSVKADIVQKFFDGRQRWLDQKAAERKAASETAVADDDIPF